MKTLSVDNAALRVDNAALHVRLDGMDLIYIRHLLVQVRLKSLEALDDVHQKETIGKSSLRVFLSVQENSICSVICS